MGNDYIQDPKVAFIQRSVDTPSMIRSYFPNWSEDESSVICHEGHDTKPSLHISPDGKAYCHGCGFKSGGIVDFLAKIEGLDYNEAKDMLYDDLVDAVPDSLVLACEKLMVKYPVAVDYLLSMRGLTAETVAKYRLGFDVATDRVVIPIFDQFRTCVNMRLIGYHNNHKMKAINVRNKGEIRVYPEQFIMLTRRVLLVEGEWDCLVARQMGLPAFTWTGGASNWNEKYENLFKDKAVFILYDRDAAGKAGAKMCAERLKNIAQHVEILTPPKTKGKDISDWAKVRSGAVWLERTKVMISTYKFPKKSLRKNYCPHCGQEVKNTKRS
jgi:DNA primase